MQAEDKLNIEEPSASYVKAVPTHIIFHNEENAYTVMRARIEETNETFPDQVIAMTGFFPVIHLHESYHFHGAVKVHPKYGKQYEVHQFRKLLPESKSGMIQYLSGDLFPGIGKKTAERIVETLGEDAVTRILEDPSCLEKVPHLPRERANMLVEALYEHEGLEKVMIELSEFGFGPQLSMKIYQAYHNQASEVLRENPYQLAEDIEGIGFQRADELALKLGFTRDDPARIQSGCLYWLTEQAMNDGHVFMGYDETVDTVAGLLSHKDFPVSELLVINELEALQDEEKLMIEDQAIYLPSLYFAEKGVVSRLKEVLEQDFNDEFSEAEFLDALGSLEERLGIEYAPTQKEAIKKAVMSPLLLLNGGPGTGKTTVIKGIVEVYAELHGLSLDPKDYDDDENPYPIALCAPTGRAAKRMTEATGIPSVTIHRLLGWKGGDGYEFDEEHRLGCRLLIVDEMSMVDLWLANQLFKSTESPIQIVIVGDEDQLPSVGPGQVLYDLLHSGVLPNVELTDIYRQAKGSSIIRMAHDIKKGELPDDLARPFDDRRFFACGTGQITEAVNQICENAKNKGFKPKDIQVLAPMYRGQSGINAINTSLQDLFNPKTEEVRTLIFGDIEYRKGDKVLQLANNPEEQVFNGDMGEIEAIIYAKETVEKEDMMVVNFEGTEVTYKKKDLNQLTLAYCCSIHKSQGSEFPIVILPLVKNYRRMLKRNLIYTAVTRSKEFLILCGEEEAIGFAIKNNDVDRRHSRLKEKLQERLSTEV